MSTQWPKKQEAADCFNCLAAQRPCDRTRHRCNKCFLESDICKGYPRQLQWLPGVKSRGRNKGQSLSIQSSSREWQPTTPTSHNFTFKQGRVHRRRKTGAGSVKTSSTPREAVQQLPIQTEVTEVTEVDEIKSSLPQTAEDEAASVTTEGLDEISGFGSIDAYDPFVLFDGFDIMVDSYDNPFSLDLGSADDTILPLQLQTNLPQHNEWTTPASVSISMMASSAATGSPAASISLSPSLESSELLTFYDRELCTLPLTYDFSDNPFRVSISASRGPKYLVHALLAISLEHVTRLNGELVDRDSVSQQITTYQLLARDECGAAVTVASEHNLKHVLDTMLVLFALDTLTSAVGSWRMRLADAYQRIEKIGGTRLAAPRSRTCAQLTMFLWWDCNIALLGRSNTIFPQSYYSFLLCCDGDAWRNVFALSGVPKELFQHIKELAELAGEREQISRLKHAIFDTTRAVELETSIGEYSIGSPGDQVSTGSEDTIQSWHDYYHTSNAWKYALLLYICRVLKWDRFSSAIALEVGSLSRLTLDSVRCCRPDSPLQKQLLLPVFLAGSEAVDSYSRSFVDDYCERWYSKCRYSMFREASALLHDIWARRDRETNQFAVWWGSVMDDKQADGRGFLFG